MSYSINIQLMHSFEVNIRICQHARVIFTEAGDIHVTMSLFLTRPTWNIYLFNGDYIFSIDSDILLEQHFDPTYYS